VGETTRHVTGRSPSSLRHGTLCKVCRILGALPPLCFSKSESARLLVKRSRPKPRLAPALSLARHTLQSVPHPRRTPTVMLHQSESALLLVNRSRPKPHLAPALPLRTAHFAKCAASSARRGNNKAR